MAVRWRGRGWPGSSRHAAMALRNGPAREPSGGHQPDRPVRARAAAGSPGRGRRAARAGRPGWPPGGCRCGSGSGRRGSGLGPGRAGTGRGPAVIAAASAGRAARRAGAAAGRPGGQQGPDLRRWPARRSGLSTVMAVAARAAVSAALAGGNRLGWRRAAGGCWSRSRQAASACGPRAGELAPPVPGAAPRMRRCPGRRARRAVSRGPGVIET